MQDFAQETLARRRNQLVQRLASDQKPVRTAAAQELAQGWRADGRVVFEATSLGSASPEVVSNAMTVLESADKSALKKNMGAVESFLQKAESKRVLPQSDTARIGRLRERLKAAD